MVRGGLSFTWKWIRMLVSKRVALWQAGGDEVRTGSVGACVITVRPATMPSSCLCLIMTPLGLPVDPDVYMITAIDSLLGMLIATCDARR